MITPFCIAAGGHGGGGKDKALAKSRVKELIQTLREPNFSHSGGAKLLLF